MTIDLAKAQFDALVPEWTAVDPESSTESDTRFKIIDRMLAEVMGWERTNIQMEPHGESGYVDYLLSRGDRNCLVLEAKRKGRLLVNTRNPNVANYKLGGPALDSARDGIAQARKYCVDHGVSYSIVTTGEEWIFFIAIRTDGRAPLEGTAIVFPTLQSVEKNFAMFHDLLSKSGNEKELPRVRLQEAEGLEVTFSDELYSIRNPRGLRLMQKSELAIDLEQVFSQFFGTMSGDNDPEMLAECFVETRESRDADATLDKITRTLTNQIRVVDSSRGGALARRIEAAVETRRGEFVLVIGNKGAGKSTFIDRFFRLVLDRTIREKSLLSQQSYRTSS